MGWGPRWETGGGELRPAVHVSASYGHNVAGSLMTLLLCFLGHSGLHSQAVSQNKAFPP